METPDINLFALLKGYLLVFIPLFILLYYRTGLFRDALIALIRMNLQLLGVGLYLKYIFILDNLWLNLAWVLLMILITAGTVNRRISRSYRYLFGPIFLSVLIAVSLCETIFLGLVLETDSPLNARLLIPVTGMILGNILQGCVIGIGAFYRSLKNSHQEYLFALSRGATRHEALLPFLRSALKEAANPAIAGMASIGLVALPGMMTGQILGGSEPMLAVKYQIMIMLSIFSASQLAVFLGIQFSKRIAFDDFDLLKNEIVSR